MRKLVDSTHFLDVTDSNLAWLEWEIHGVARCFDVWMPTFADY